MCHGILGDARLFAALRYFDEDLARRERERGCRCGGALHVANYPRKPRGTRDEISREDDLRFSFCCEREGCRKRVTPRSVRFLGRRVYLGVVVVLISAMMNGPTPRRVAALSAEIGASERTLRRWRIWWRTLFVESRFWRAARASFAEPVADETLPHSLVERFGGDEGQRLTRALRFLSPITTSSANLDVAF